jgi:hypothetical protein
MDEVKQNLKIKNSKMMLQQKEIIKKLSTIMMPATFVRNKHYSNLEIKEYYNRGNTLFLYFSNK